MYKVYQLYKNALVFQGGYCECKRWILNRCTTLTRNGKLFRVWEQDGKKFFDVGEVYYMVQDFE